MALTNLEARHIRLMKKAEDLVDRRRSFSTASALATPSFFETLMSETTSLFNGVDREHLFSTIRRGNCNINDLGISFIRERLRTRLSTLALYPDRNYRKAHSVKRSFGLQDGVPCEARSAYVIDRISLMTFEYVACVQIITAVATVFEE